MAYFTFNGKSNEEFGLRIGEGLDYVTSSYDIERVTVPGRDGELLIDNKRLGSVEHSIPLNLVKEKGLITDKISDIVHWLGVKGYQDMTFSWDKDHIYKGAYLEGFSVEETLKQFGKTKLTFILNPIKFHKEGLKPIKVTNGMTIKGKGNVTAHPVVSLRGSGECVLSINGRQTKFKNLQGALTADMQKQIVHDGKLAAWDKVVRSPQFVMPSLDPGDNKISWTGNVTVEIIPYWGVRI